MSLRLFARSFSSLSLFFIVGTSGCGSSDDGAAPVDSAPADAGNDGPIADVGDAADTIDAAPPPAVVISAADDSKYEAEPQIAIAPDGTIGVAWIGTPNTTEHPTAIGYAFSRDHGATFSAPQYIFVTKTLIAGDPSIAATKDSAFHLSFIDVIFDSKGPVSGHVFMAIAPPGAAKFNDAVEVSDPATVMFRDHPKLAITAAGTTIIAYLESPDGTAIGNQGVAGTSKDGLTWSRSIIAPSDKGGGSFFFPCQAKEGGRVYMPYLGPTGAINGILLRTSDDEGATWSTKATTVTTTRDPQVANHDPSCAAAGDDVWIDYDISTVPPATADEGDQQPGTAIRVAHSADRGQTIALRIDATDPAAPKQNLFSTIARTDDGALHLAYYAGTGDGDTAAMLRHARSTDLAAFEPSESIDGPLLFQLKRASADWLGDYISAVHDGNDLWVAWTTNASGTSHIAVRRLPAH